LSKFDIPLILYFLNKPKFYMTKLYRLALLLSVICLTGLTEVYAQRTVVSGNIVDEKGETLIGVNILVKGTVNGTISDVISR